MRILRVIARMNVGGPAYHVSLLSGRLAPERYATLLVTGNVGPGEDSMMDIATGYGIRPVVLGTLGPELQPVDDLRALGALVRIGRRFRPHIVHTHTAKAGTVGRLAALCLRPRPVVVHTYHGHVLEGYFAPAWNALYRGIERSLARFSDRLIGVSSATVADLVRLGVAPAERFEVIPVGLPLEPYLALAPEPGGSVRGELGAGADDVLLTYVGRLVPIKRVDVLVRAFAHARAKAAPVRLAIVGDGPERPALRALAAQLGVSEHVRFTGYRRDLPRIVAATDVAVLSSDNEGTPVALIEAAAGARPLVATRAGGVPDVVAGGTGMLVERGDHVALGEAIRALAADPKRRRRFGAAAREHVRDRYASDTLVARIDDLYGRLLAES